MSYFVLSKTNKESKRLRERPKLPIERNNDNCTNLYFVKSKTYKEREREQETDKEMERQKQPQRQGTNMNKVEGMIDDKNDDNDEEG